MNLIEDDIKGSIWKTEEAFGARPVLHKEEEGGGEEEEVLTVQVCSSLNLSDESCFLSTRRSRKPGCVPGEEPFNSVLLPSPSDN